MGMAHKLSASDADLIQATEYRLIDLDDASQVGAAVEWWETLTAKGGGGMVVKPLDFIVRGREYLRIIYGPHYDRPGNIEWLKKRGLGQKRLMALPEFALGIEALNRFVDHAPLTRVHQCVFGV